MTGIDMSMNQAAEAWQTLGPWIDAAMPEFGPGIKERFEAASKITHEQACTRLVDAHAIC